MTDIMVDMVDMRQEPAMEDVLASIKRIIAEDGAAVVPPRPRPAGGGQPTADAVPCAAPVDPTSPLPSESCEILELTEPAPPLVSPDAATASRHSLDTLSALMVRGNGPAADNTLEGLMRDLLRPMLKEWLDARLPDIVGALVAVEIKRITGKG